MSPQSLLRKSFCGSHLCRAGVAFLAWFGPSSSASRVITEAQRRVPAHQERWRPLAERSGPVARPPALAADGVATPLNSRPRLVRGTASRGRALSVSQLPRQPARRRAKRVPTFMANTHRLLALRDCDYYLQRLGIAREVRSNPRRSEAARGEGHHPAVVYEEVLAEMRAFVAEPASPTFSPVLSRRERRKSRP